METIIDEYNTMIAHIPNITDFFIKIVFI
jgi:hypothetical protein